MSFKCEDCNDTGVIFGTMGVEHKCHCRIKDVSDVDLADIAINELAELRTENEQLRARVAELEANNARMRNCLRGLENIISDISTDINFSRPQLLKEINNTLWENM